jgi:excisionase family DNA binding protein
MSTLTGTPRQREPDTLTRLPTFLTVDELAALMRLNRKTVYDAIDKGEIPGAQRIGRSIRITRDTVVAWLKSQGRVSRSSGGHR